MAMQQDTYKKSSNFRLLIRMIGTSVDGQKLVEYGLTQIKGVGIRLSQAVVRIAGISPLRRMGDLSEEECDTLEKIIKNPWNLAFQGGWLIGKKTFALGKIDISVELT